MRSVTGLWTLPDLKSRVEVVSRRVYGQQKLKKPSLLSGVSSAFSVDFIAGKCRCQCFIHGDDVYVKHRDFGSTEVYGGMYEEHPSHRRKFIYNDSYGCIVLRGEAWLRLCGVIEDIMAGHRHPQIANALVVSLFGEPSFGDWYRFFETVAMETIKLKENLRCRN